jgi:uncharacterized protein
MMQVRIDKLSDGHPIFEACSNGNLDFLKSYLEKGGSVYTHGENIPFISALIVGAGHFDLLKELVAHNLDLNRPFNSFGESLLTQAIRYNQVPIVKYLLEKGIDVNLPDGSGISSFIMACGGASTEVLQMLINTGGNLQDKRYSGHTPVFRAAQSGRVDLIDLLAKHGADIDEPDNLRKTPLIIAAQAGRLEVVKWLLDHGADVKKQDNRGKDALTWAKANNHHEIVTLLTKQTS